MKAVVQIGVGEPESSLALRDIPSPGTPDDDNVIVDVDLASVHHGDLFMSRLVRSVPPEGFIRRGNEAVGRVSAVGREAARTSNLRVGDRVTTFLAPYAWAEQVECPAALVLSAPDDIPDMIAAQLFVNTVTAFMVARSIEEALVARDARNGLVLLTGASTAVGRVLAHLMREAGIEVIGLTRSETAAARTGEIIPGVRYVARAAKDWFAQLEAAAGGRRFVALADCVSGALLAELNPLIADGAAIVTYGGLDPNPIGLTGLEVAARGLDIRGLPIFPWLSMAAEKRKADISAAAALARAHPELFPAGGIYALEDWRSAVTAVEATGRDGFVFLKPR